MGRHPAADHRALLFFANAFDIFLLRQFFRTIPEELLDAARVDGASEFYIFLNIVLPLSRPVLATITVFTFLWAWNLFLNRCST